MEEEKTEYKLLSKVNYPEDLKNLSLSELSLLASELRHYIINTVKKTGGHLAPSLGVTELTVALHYVFNAPEDKIIWDVGHQAYVHKVLTGRKEALKTIRQYGGISGFCKRSESEYDVFGAGHASTSISSAVGIAKARDLDEKDFRVVALIGDGALTGGLAYEGLDNAYYVKGQLLVILNDNEMSISPNVGAISYYLTKIVTNPKFLQFRDEVWKAVGLLPRGTRLFRLIARKIEESIKNFIVPGLLFDELGFRYYGPIDGHDFDQLLTTLNSIKDLKYPVILHVLTRKGKGLQKAEINPTKYHGVSPEKGTKTTEPQTPPFLKAFGKIACEIAEENPKAVFITAAMCEGTGLPEYADKFPDRYFDVGIAEGHATTFSGGLAAGGYRPVVAIYSTFLQRAYDHIIHDIALQSLPVVFVLDRAGLVGADGPTHHGVFDLSYLNTVPNMIISAPRDGNELRDLLNTALQQSDKPFAIRYPKASCEEFKEDKKANILDIGKWEKLYTGKEIAIISVGVMTNTAIRSLEILKEKSINPTIVHARFIKPFDEKMLSDLAKKHKIIFTIEENTIAGGFGLTVNRYVDDLNTNCKVIPIGIPDRFITHGSRDQLLHEIGLDHEGIAAEIIKAVNL